MTGFRWGMFFLVLLPSLVWGQDTTAPTVTIDSPAALDRVGGLITVEATAGDDVGVTCVKFFKGAQLLETDTAAPFTAVYNFNAESPSHDYEITVTASDQAGN